MMTRLRLAAGLAVFALTCSLLVGLAAAQDEEEPVVPTVEGVLYFSSRFKSGTETGVKAFHFNTGAPTKAASEKAYAQTSMLAQTYQTQWDYKFPQASILDGKLKLTTWLSCDIAAVYRPPANTGGVNDVHGYRLAVIKNAATTPAATGPSFTQIPNCSGPTSIFKVEAEATLAKLEFAKGDILSIQVLIWTLNPPETVAKNVHFLVNSTTHPSVIRGLGLPVPEGATPAPQITLAATPSSVEAAPGEEQMVELSITNPSAKAVNVTINATGDYNATFGTMEIQVAANATVSTTANVTVPEDAAAGDSGTVVFHASIAGKEVGNVSVPVTVVAASTSPTGGSGGSGGNGTAGSNETATAKSGGDETPGPGVGALVVAVIAGVLLRRRRIGP